MKNSRKTINSSGCPSGFALGTSLGIYRLSFIFHIRLLYSLESLEDKNKTLKHKNETLEEKNESLEEKIETLEEKNESLEEKNESLEEKNENLEEKNECLEDKNIIFCPQDFKENNILMWKTHKRR